ncbi:MAG: hypothetical protein ACD_47C00462G0001 [uncultured bacterium]|nr:MAG: hypothetical protein ACD_47C00462G0001 [uncultured bacterium]
MPDGKTLFESLLVPVLQMLGKGDLGHQDYRRFSGFYRFFDYLYIHFSLTRTGDAEYQAFVILFHGDVVRNVFDRGLLFVGENDASVVAQVINERAGLFIFELLRVERFNGVFEIDEFIKRVFDRRTRGQQALFDIFNIGRARII